MTTTNWIAVLAVVVGAVVALSVGYLQRKQMRQIELYRQDPSVGLTPPPSIATRFIRSNWGEVFGFGMPAIGLVIELINHTPPSRYDVLFISLNVAVLLTNVVMLIVFDLVNRIVAVLKELHSALKRHVDVTGATVATLRTVAERLPNSPEAPNNSSASQVCQPSTDPNAQ